MLHAGTDRELMGNPGIIRNRLKLNTTVKNARLYVCQLKHLLRQHAVG